MKRQREFDWVRLENASKIFPATCNERDTKVFRIACELKDEVEPKLLQQALDLTMADFPLYRSILRKGLFWYYLEESEIRPLVLEECTPVCAPIYEGRRKSLLFRVSCFRQRINLELFHVLSDGTGAIWFMQSLVCRYLTLRREQTGGIPLRDSRSFSVNRQMDDSFRRYFSGGLFQGREKEEKTEWKKRAYRIRGNRLPENRIMLIEGAMSTSSLLEQAHAHGTTLTVFLAALQIYAIYKEIPARRNKAPIILSVPINLRQYFPSATARNFFSTMNVGCRFDKAPPDLQTVIHDLGGSFQHNLAEEQLKHQLNRLMALEQNYFTRAIPLPLKDLAMRAAAKLANRQITSVISNVGRVVMPPEFEPMIRQFSVCTSVRRFRITMCSFGDTTVVSFTSPFRETHIQRTFFELLTDLGIEIEISSNLS